MTEQLQNGIIKLIDDAISLLSQHADPKFVNSISITWNRRMRSNAGRAFILKNKIELNPRLLCIEDEPEKSLQHLRQTLLHELAHLLAHHRHGSNISAHGPEWKQACADLGIPEETATHQLPLPSRQMRKKWRYICPNCAIEIDRVKRMKPHTACYACCKKYNGGKYSQKYQLTEYALKYTFE